MPEFIEPDFVDQWWPPAQQQVMVERLLQRVGLTRTRANYFLRLWVYAAVKHQRQRNPRLQPPLPQLESPIAPVACTHREAAELFYCDRDQGSDRAAGLILDKLAALGLLEKSFDGNQTEIAIASIPEAAAPPPADPVPCLIDGFNPRCDAIPVANFLATNYNWMNRNQQSTPYRIAGLLRQWAQQYSIGMRVLRRTDNLNPVGFYLLYPVATASEVHFFAPGHRGLHLSSLNDVDPFAMATPGAPTCQALFIRSWMIEPQYLADYRVPLVVDAQQILRKMQADFPQLCDLYTLMIHPSYEALVMALGFQRLQQGAVPIYWLYLALDRFLALDIPTALDQIG